MPEDAPLLGAVPELDSMGIVAVITTLEEHFGFSFDDDELDASSFSTVSALTELVTKKLAA
jgi:acyl carrier protein